MSGRSGQVGKLLFWLIILGVLTAFWGYLQTNSHSVPISRGPDGYDYVTSSGDSSQTIAPVAHTLMFNFGPVAIFTVSLIGVLILRGPTHRLRKIYRRDPVMQGEFTVRLTLEQLLGQNSAGATWQNSWVIYDSWREKGSLVIVILRNQSYEILNLAALTEPERAELRGILTTALPQK
jgi:hypothetical protein